MEKRSFSAPEARTESTQERAREDMRRILAKGSEPLLRNTGLTAKRAKGDAFALHMAETPRKTASETLPAKPVTFDGFEAVGLPVEEIRESFGDMLDQMASSVRFSLQPAVKIIDGKFIVAQFQEQPVGHVRIDILSLDEQEMPSKQDVMDLLKYEAAHVLRWSAHLTAEEISLVLAGRKATRVDWIDTAVASLLTRGLPLAEAKQKAMRVVDDVIASRKRL